MGFEPTTPTLARLCSTPELRPHSVKRLIAESAYQRNPITALFCIFPKFFLQYQENCHFYGELQRLVQPPLALRSHEADLSGRLAHGTKRIFTS